MSVSFDRLTKLFSSPKNAKVLKNSEHGLERECLRITTKGELSKKNHPEKLGSALKNKYITTDFTEPQLELVTPIFKSEQEAINFLQNIHIFVSKNLNEEVLWPLSMPCQLPKKEKEIPLAKYGKSHEGKQKTIYRRGLGVRYGRKMQTISGTHYNFSFSSEFWELIYKKSKSKKPKKEFITESYFELTRNFLRYGWLNTYLFGASPTFDNSFMKKKPRPIKRFSKNTYYAPSATSFRTSKFGYYSKVQEQLAVSFNSLNAYIRDLEKLTKKEKALYKKIGIYQKNKQIQINTNILQDEAEHYSRIRPKPDLQEDRPIQALKKRGIKYLEVRAVDIDPLNPIGVGKDQLCFLNIFLTYCLFKNSPRINKKEQKEITENQNAVALFGRNKNLELLRKNKKVNLQTWALEILKEMKEVAEIMDLNFSDKRYTKSLERQEEKVKDSTKTPSAEIIQKMKENKYSHLDFGLHLAKKNFNKLSQSKISERIKKKLEKEKENSLNQQKKQEIYDEMYLQGFEDMELSTQCLIREAKKRNIEIDILDRKDNFIRLKKNKKVQYVKQATKTAKDNYMTFLIMENKQVSKIILQEHNISVPFGHEYRSKKDALKNYHNFKNKKIVLKPASTNFGLGIHFIEPKDKKNYEQALTEAFSFDKSVIIEEFIKGGEYRFLVINNRVIAILNRIPAHVIGDGNHSIKELVEIKKNNPKTYKQPKHHPRIEKTELKELEKQGLTPSSVPKKGKKIFLRQNSNISTGGDHIDVTDQIPDSYKKIAIKAAKAAKAKICGVDMIIKNPNSPPNKKNHAVIEINFNPAIDIHTFPEKGEKRLVANAVLDLLGF